MISEDRGRGVEADWTLRQALQRPTLSLTAHDDDHLAGPRDRRQPQRHRVLGERTSAGRHVRSVGGHIVDALLEQPYGPGDRRSEEHTSELQSRFDLVCRLLLEKK